MADDLVQRLRAQASAYSSFTASNELFEAAEALARKDAEIARLSGAVAYAEAARHESDGLTWRAISEREGARKVADQQRQRAERAEARVREAPVYAVPTKKPTTQDGWLAVIDSVKNLDKLRGKRVALVLLDTEEAK